MVWRVVSALRAQEESTRSDKINIRQLYGLFGSVCWVYFVLLTSGLSGHFSQIVPTLSAKQKWPSGLRR